MNTTSLMLPLGGRSRVEAALAVGQGDVNEATGVQHPLLGTAGKRLRLLGLLDLRSTGLNTTSVLMLVVYSIF